MTKAKNESIVEYKGKFEGLVIKVNGIIVYSDKLKKTIKSPALQKDQDDLGLASKFASCINSVPELARIWRSAKMKRRRTVKGKEIEYTEKANFGRTKAFNKIVSANRKEISSKGRPNIYNVIVPEKESFPYNYSACLNSKGVDIDLIIPTDIDKRVIHEHSTIVPVVVFCFFDSTKDSDSKFELMAKYCEVKDFQSSDIFNIHFPITPEELKTIKIFNSCVFYFAIVEHSKNLKRVRWFRHDKGLEFSLDGFPKKSISFKK
jgi:hypothetical protein